MITKMHAEETCHQSQTKGAAVGARLAQETCRGRCSAAICARGAFETRSRRIQRRSSGVGPIRTRDTILDGGLRGTRAVGRLHTHGADSGTKAASIEARSAFHADREATGGSKGACSAADAAGQKIEAHCAAVGP